jgi:thymidylate synthase (FAD)
MNVTFVHCSPDAENLIVRMARVSNPANEDNMATAPKLLRYLIDHQHWSPFEMCSLCVKIDTERDISAQILRHRSFSFQEFSTRYAEAQPLTVPELRKQDVKNRQNSTNDLDIHTQVYYDEQIRNQYADIEELYEEMIADGVAKECARRILPLSTQTTLYMHGTLRSFIHYIKVRTDASTQLEHRLIAESCKQIFIEQFPTIGEAAFRGGVKSSE